MCLLPGSSGRAQSRSAQAWKEVVGQSGASVVLLDVASGEAETMGAVDRASLPGSTLKPLVLHAALAAHVINARTPIQCSGEMRIGRYNLACSHPRAIPVQDAEMALANSCNTYFATVARQMQSADLVRGLAAFGLSAERMPATPDDRALLALGLAGVEVSPRELASAYSKLAVTLSGNDAMERTIRNGLLASVNSGMAHAARTDGVLLGGKTGSAHDGTPSGQHGWFAGVVFVTDAHVPKATRVLVVEVSGGNGNDAALLAHRLLERAR